MKIDIDGKRFRAVSNSGTGEVGDGTVFHYHQEDGMVWSNYNGGRIIRGHLIGTLVTDGSGDARLDARYHHINNTGAIMTGISSTRIELLPDGKYRLHESWQWTSGDHSKGTSVMEEVDAEALKVSA